MRKAFEIVYADGSSKKAPEDGIQFVIMREKDGSLTKYKACDEYGFNGAKKGARRDPDNYERLKASLLSARSYWWRPHLGAGAGLPDAATIAVLLPG